MQRRAQITSLVGFNDNANAIVVRSIEGRLGVMEWEEEGRGREDGRRMLSIYRHTAGEGAEEGLRKFS
jgi:hypothetical protein